MCKDNVQKMDGNKLYDLLEGDWRFNDCARQNVLLLFLSDRKDKDKCSYNIYTAFNGKYYTGKNTNDAPVQTLIDQASKDGNDIDTVLCIVSKLVFMSRSNDVGSKRNTGDNYTDYEVFEELIHTYCTENKKNIPAIIPVPYDFKVLDDRDRSFIDIDIEKRQLAVYERLTKLIQKKSTVYMDYTGGFRDMNFMLAMLLQYMELQGIKCNGIVYSVLREGKVVDLLNVYDFNRIITGTNEYIHTGRAEQLLRFYKEKEKKKSTRELTKIIAIIESLQKFSDMISVCNVSQMDEERRRLQEVLNEAKTISDSEDINISLFKRMFDNIHKGMHLGNNDNNEFTYPMIIQWCLDRNLLQQALTIYIEKMPEYYVEKNRNSCSPFIPEKYQLDGNNRRSTAEVFYDKLYEPFFEIRRKEFQAMFNNILNAANTGDQITKATAIGILDDPAWNGFDEQRDNLRTHIRQNYEDDGNLRQGRGSLDTTIRILFNRLKNVEKPKPYYQLGDTDNFDNWMERKTYKSYGKKVQGCMDMDNSENEYLAEIMQIYLILKIARNHMNHAASEEMENNQTNSADNAKAKEYFQWDDFSLVRDFVYIKNIIQIGIILETDN